MAVILGFYFSLNCDLVPFFVGHSCSAPIELFSPFSVNQFLFFSEAPWSPIFSVTACFFAGCAIFFIYRDIGFFQGVLGSFFYILSQRVAESPFVLIAFLLQLYYFPFFSWLSVVIVGVAGVIGGVYLTNKFFGMGCFRGKPQILISLFIKIFDYLFVIMYVFYA